MTSMMTYGNNAMERAESAELAAQASAAQAAAIIQAQFAIAFKRPRNMDDARARIMAMCASPEFAEKAIYSKPIGKDRVRGFSIRAAEGFSAIMTNMRTSRMTLWDDADKKILRVEAMDLQLNNSQTREVTIAKTIERKDKRGRTVLEERVNSYGDTVYIVRPTDDELLVKTSALCAKEERECILKLIPPEWRMQAMGICLNAIENGAKDGNPEDLRKKLVESFYAIGVSAEDLSRFLGHSVAALAPKERAELRQIYTAIRDGEAVWSDFSKAQESEEPTEKKPSKTEDMLNKLKNKKAPEAEIIDEVPAKNS